MPYSTGLFQYVNDITEEYLKVYFKVRVQVR